MCPSRWVDGSRVRDHVWSEPAGAAETPAIHLATPSGEALSLSDPLFLSGWAEFWLNQVASAREELWLS